MSNGYYTSPTYNYPAPKNVGGYNATQLSLQKQIQEQVRLKNQMVRDAKTFANAPTFSDHIKEFWGLKINEFSNAQNEWIGGNMSATESANIKENLEILWKTWTTSAPYIAALGETVRKYGKAGELDKLNDPNLEALLSHMQQNDGSVILKNDGNKLYLSGRGEIDEKNVNGENTGNKLPWEYDLDLESFLQIIGVNTYEQDPEGKGVSNTILDNLNNIIQRRATDQTIDFESTMEAAISQSSKEYDVPMKDKNNKNTDRTEALNFTFLPLLQRNLNHGGLNGTGLGSTDQGTTMWVGTEDNPSIMNSSQFASYYANVLYKDYQPHYNDMGDIDWLIDYDDSGNEVDRVKPWNLSDQSLWDPARDMLTQKSIKESQQLNQALMLQLKPNYQEILDTKYNGDWLEFTKKGNAGHEISRNPFEFYEGTTDNAQGFWEEAQKNNPLPGDIEEEDDEVIDEVVYGSTQTRAQAIAAIVKQTKEDPEILLGGPGRFESGTSLADYFNTLEMTDEESGNTYTVSDYLNQLPLEIQGKLNEHMGEISLVGNDKKSNQMILKIWDRTTSKELRKILEDKGWDWEGINQTGSGNDKYWAKPFNIQETKDVERLWQLILGELEKIGANVKAKR